MMIPYKQRCNKWGVTVGFSSGRYAPENYETNFTNDNTPKVYEGQDMVEFHLNIKRNLSWRVSWGMFGVASYSDTGNDEHIPSELNLTSIRLGLQYTIDHLFDEPFVAPYLSGGIYTAFYKEELDGEDNLSFSGNTSPSFYGAAGLLIQLDWLDARSAVESYQEIGLENTFLFLEAQYSGGRKMTKNPTCHPLYKDWFKSRILISSSLLIRPSYKFLVKRTPKVTIIVVKICSGLIFIF